MRELQNDRDKKMNPAKKNTHARTELLICTSKLENENKKKLRVKRKKRERNGEIACTRDAHTFISKINLFQIAETKNNNFRFK